MFLKPNRAPRLLLLGVALAAAVSSTTASAAGVNCDDDAHAALADFIHASLDNFRIDEPLSSGSVSFTSNGTDLVQIVGDIQLEFASFRQLLIPTGGVVINLAATGTGTDPQVYIALEGVNPIITGRYNLSGNVGHDENLGGVGNVTIVPHIEAVLRANCSLRVTTSPSGHLQLGSCYLTTGLLPLVGSNATGDTYVYYSPRLVNASSLVEDVHSLTLTRPGAEMGARLGAGLMAAIVSHLQADFNATRVLDILAGARPSGRPKLQSQAGWESLDFGSSADMKEIGTIKRKLEQFGVDVLRNLTRLPSFNPYFPPTSNNHSIFSDRPVVKVDGRIWNVSLFGFDGDITFEAHANYEVKPMQLELYVNVHGGELTGGFKLAGNLTSEHPFSDREGIFTIRNTTLRIGFRPSFDVVNGRFVPKTTLMLGEKFTDFGNASFSPSLLPEMTEQVRSYLENRVAQVIFHFLDISSFNYSIKDRLLREVKSQFEGNPALDILFR